MGQLNKSIFIWKPLGDNTGIDWLSNTNNKYKSLLCSMCLFEWTI